MRTASLHDLICLTFLFLLPNVVVAQDSNTDAHDDVSSVKKAIESLRTLPQWSHLDPAWVDSIHQSQLDAMGKNRPTVNVAVSVNGPDGQRIEGAVVMIQESVSRFVNRFSSLSHIPEPFTATRSIQLTGPDGACIFDRLFMSAPGDREGRVQAGVMVILPTGEFDFERLLCMSRPQAIKLELGASRPLDLVLNDDKGTAVEGVTLGIRRISRTGQTTFFSSYQGGFEPDRRFCPVATSDQNGVVKFAKMPTNVSCFLSLTGTSNWKPKESREPFVVGAKQATLVMEPIVERKPARFQFLDGRDGKPIAGVRVPWSWDDDVVVSDDGGRLATTRYMSGYGGQSNPSYRFRFLPPSAWVAEIVNVPIAGVEDLIPIQLARSTTVSGRVIDDLTGNGIPCVYIFSSSVKVESDSTVQRSSTASGYTDAEGKFQLPLAPGTYTVSIRPPVLGYHAPSVSRRDRSQAKLEPPAFLSQSVHVGDQPVAGIEFKLSPAPPIGGRVVNSEGDGVAGAEVFCHLDMAGPDSRENLPLGATINTAITDSDGRFMLAPPAGELRSLTLTAKLGDRRPYALISPSVLSSGDVDQFKPRGDVVMTDSEGSYETVTKFGIRSSRTVVHPVDCPASLIYSRPIGGKAPSVSPGFSITGRIVDSDGEPVGDYVVCAGSGYSSPGTIRVATDENGRFRIDQLPMIDQFTLFGDISQANSLKLNSRRFQRGEPNELLDFGDLTLEPGYELAVKFLPAADRLPPKMTVRIELPVGGPSISATALGGELLLNSVPSGPIEIWFGGGRAVNVDQTIPEMQRLYNPGQFIFNMKSNQVVLVQLK